ncbi:hypothetical protein [Microbacterium sp.]|uniref:hypothetical protein n=1 Tax=Microbacterium sp. TaxID=51671 RepID=UPI003F946ED1
MIGGRRAAALLAIAGLAVGLAACADTGTGNQDPDESTPTPTEAAPTATAETEPTGPTEDELRAVVADAEWLYSPEGLREPIAVTIAAGAATDDIGRIYTVGEEDVPADLNGDGLLDLAVTIDQLDGNGFERLWYVWLGAEDGSASQLEYPIARASRCGDSITSVTAVDEGLRIEGTLYDPSLGIDVCADGSSEEFARTVDVRDFGGEAYPVQSEPIAAWGGHCPRSSWQDGEAMTETDVTVAPVEGADTAVAADSWFLPLGLSDAPRDDLALVWSDEMSFFAFMHVESDGATAFGEQACGFTAAP